jgi:hypothetical protein
VWTAAQKSGLAKSALQTRAEILPQKDRASNRISRLVASGLVFSAARAEDSRHCAAPRWLKVSFEFDPDLPLHCVLSLHDNFGAAFQISKFILLNTTTLVVARKHLSGNENSCSYICSNLRRQQTPCRWREWNGQSTPS